VASYGAGVTADDRTRLRADCARCVGLCCVVPAFAASADFAIDKAAGEPCPNLRADFRCGIHDRLRERGFPGCATYDCFGAGQHVTQVTFSGRDWRQAPGVAAQMFAAFPVMRALHELLWYLTEALALAAAEPLHAGLRRIRADVDEYTRLDPAGLAALDLPGLRRRAGDLLGGASELVRHQVRERPPDRRDADLVGANLAGADLRAANLRSAQLIGADLSGADLRTADLLGADVRGTDLSGADLSGSLFLVQAQLDAARGDAGTTLPTAVHHPAHWPA